MPGQWRRRITNLINTNKKKNGPESNCVLCRFRPVSQSPSCEKTGRGTGNTIGRLSLVSRWFRFKRTPRQQHHLRPSAGGGEGIGRRRRSRRRGSLQRNHNSTGIPSTIHSNSVVICLLRSFLSERARRCRATHVSGGVRCPGQTSKNVFPLPRFHGCSGEHPAAPTLPEINHL